MTSYVLKYWTVNNKLSVGQWFIILVGTSACCIWQSCSCESFLTNNFDARKMWILNSSKSLNLRSLWLPICPLALNRAIYEPLSASIKYVLFIHSSIYSHKFCASRQSCCIWQGDCRTYSYVAGLSTDAKNPNWGNLYTLARIIPRVCTNINRYSHYQ